LKYEIVQVCSFTLPFTLLDLGFDRMVCCALAILSCALFPPVISMLDRRPWSDTIVMAVMSTVFGSITAAIIGAMLTPDQLIYGAMLKHHIPVTLPIMLLMIVTITIPALVQILWDFNSRPKPLPPPDFDLIDEHKPQ
jgi:hypothetical protein